MALELVGIEAGYGGARVVQGISLAVPEGSIVTLLGPNGVFSNGSSLRLTTRGTLALVRLPVKRFPSIHEKWIFHAP